MQKKKLCNFFLVFACLNGFCFTRTKDFPMWFTRIKMYADLSDKKKPTFCSYYKVRLKLQSNKKYLSVTAINSNFQFLQQNFPQNSIIPSFLFIINFCDQTQTIPFYINSKPIITIPISIHIRIRHFILLLRLPWVRI